MGKNRSCERSGIRSRALIDYFHPLMLEQQVKIVNKLGLHVRAATKLVQKASEFDVDISISCNDQTADAKSIMDVLMLAAIIGTKVDIVIAGDSVEDEQEAMDSLISLIANRFDEGE